jgi:hypothetical protein
MNYHLLATKVGAMMPKLRSGAMMQKLKEQRQQAKGNQMDIGLVSEEGGMVSEQI